MRDLKIAWKLIGAAILILTAKSQADSPTIVEITESLFGDVIAYQSLSESAAARKKSVQSLEKRCLEWKKAVTAEIGSKALFLEMECAPPKRPIHVDRLGSATGKSLQASVQALLRIGPKAGYLVVDDAIRAAYVFDQQNAVYAAIGSYEGRCAQWKANLRARFGKMLLHASCGGNRVIYHEQELADPPPPPRPDFYRTDVERFRTVAPINVPGYRISSQGQFLLLLDDDTGSFAQFLGHPSRSEPLEKYIPSRRGTMVFDHQYRPDGYPADADPASARMTEEAFYWQCCGAFKAEMAARFGSRLVYASCEESLEATTRERENAVRWPGGYDEIAQGSDLVQGFARYSGGGGYTMTAPGFMWAGFSAGTMGRVWYLR